MLPKITDNEYINYRIISSNEAKERIIQIVRGQPYENMERDLNNLSALLNDIDANDLIAFLAQMDRKGLNMIGIYKIENQINHKIYIGQSINIEKRFNKHKSSAFNPNDKQYNNYFYSSIRKYGIKNFTFSVIEKCKRNELDERERYWIQYYNSTNPEKGYNLTDGGQNAITYTPKLDHDKVNQIKNLLKNSIISEAEIAEKFNVSQKMISEINQGNAWVSENTQYPIRTYSLKKEIQPRYKCKKCGKILQWETKNSLCRECYEKSTRIVDRPSREKLKFEVRYFSFLTLGKQYGVSDNAIRKWCINYNIPSKRKDINIIPDLKWINI